MCKRFFSFLLFSFAVPGEVLYVLHGFLLQYIPLILAWNLYFFDQCKDERLQLFVHYHLPFTDIRFLSVSSFLLCQCQTLIQSLISFLIYILNMCRAWRPFFVLWLFCYHKGNNVFSPMVSFTIIWKVHSRVFFLRWKNVLYVISTNSFYKL